MTASRDPNTSLLKALGLGHLQHVTAVDIQLRPGELPLARIEKHLMNFDSDNSEVLHWELVRAERAESKPLDLEAMATAARERVAVGIELATIRARAGVAEDFALANARIARAGWVRDFAHFLVNVPLLPNLVGGFRRG